MDHLRLLAVQRPRLFGILLVVVGATLLGAAYFAERAANIRSSSLLGAAFALLLCGAWVVGTGRTYTRDESAPVWYSVGAACCGIGGFLIGLFVAAPLV